MILSVVIRINFDPRIISDLGVYARIMQYHEIPYLFYREFIFYFGIKILYDLIGNVIGVFVVLDFIFYILLYKWLLLLRKGFFLKVKSHNSYYIYFAILIFFPFVLGMHTLLRQMLATVIVMNAFGCIGNKKYLKGIIIFLISFFVHNAAIYMLPVLLFTIRKPMTKTLSLIMLFLIVFINLNITTTSNELLMRDFTTNVEGYKITLSYIFSLLSILLLVGMMEVFNSKVRKIYFVWTLLILIIIYFSALSSFSSGISQRAAFLAFSYLFPILALYIDLIFKEKKLMRIIFLNISILPLIFVHNSTIDLTPIFK